MHTGAGGGGEEGATSCTPSKDFEQLDHKNAINHKNRENPLPDFLTTPSTPANPQKNYKMIQVFLLRIFKSSPVKAATTTICEVISLRVI